jgi:hypothetical protein
MSNQPGIFEGTTHVWADLPSRLIVDRTVRRSAVRWPGGRCGGPVGQFGG